MPDDKVGTKDAVGVTLNAVAAPHNPCPVCGRETSEHHPVQIAQGVFRRRRICTDGRCRHITVESEPN